MLRISIESPDDTQEVEYLYDLAFAPGRQALSSYRLRDGVPPVAKLCMVARGEEGALAGAIRYWPVRIGAAKALLLGPIAVHPTRQGEGVGAELVEASLTRAEALAGSGCCWWGMRLITNALGLRELTGWKCHHQRTPIGCLGGHWLRARLMGLSGWSDKKNDRRAPRGHGQRQAVFSLLKNVLWSSGALAPQRPKQARNCRTAPGVRLVRTQKSPAGEGGAKGGNDEQLLGFRRAFRRGFAGAACQSGSVFRRAYSSNRSSHCSLVRLLAPRQLGGWNHGFHR